MPSLKVVHAHNTILSHPHNSNKYHDNEALGSVISYCLNPLKTHGMIGAFGVNIQQAAIEMELLASAYGKASGLRLRHFVLSFSEKETKRLGKGVYDELLKIAWYAASFYACDYQIVYAVHQDAANPHVHFVMSTVNAYSRFPRPAGS